LNLLPDAFASDPERLAQFQREAQMLAALNHPNSAQIYGLEGDNVPVEEQSAAPITMTLNWQPKP